MKKIIFLVFVGILLTSCGSDNSEEENNNIVKKLNDSTTCNLIEIRIDIECGKDLRGWKNKVATGIVQVDNLLNRCRKERNCPDDSSVSKASFVYSQVYQKLDSAYEIDFSAGICKKMDNLYLEKGRRKATLCSKANELLEQL